MSARAVKVHLIAERRVSDTRHIKTFCGKDGRECRGWSGEFDTPNCDRFSATEVERDVDCKTCLRALARAKREM